MDLLDACMGITTTDTQIAVIVDSDDPALPAYRALPLGGFAELVVADKSVIPAPAKIGQILNHFVPIFAKQHPYIGFMGDDHRPRTKDWDALLVQALDRPGVAYGNDLLQGERLPTECVISSEVINALGFMNPPGCDHLYLDDFWKLLGKTAGNLAYLPDVIVEHLHPGGGKAAVDAGYAYSMARETIDHDREQFEAYVNGRWQTDRRKVEALRG